MDRSSILATLSKLRYCILWPDHVDDIGFTERPIWVCSEGYGYFFDDEPCSFVIIEGVSQTQVGEIKEKLVHGLLTSEDIEGSPFESLDLFDSSESLVTMMRDLVNLPDLFSDCIYCGQDMDGWTFFNSEEALIAAFAKDGKHYNFREKWADLDDEHLKQWYEQLFVEQPDLLLPMTLGVLGK